MLLVFHSRNSLSLSTLAPTFSTVDLEVLCMFVHLPSLVQLSSIVLLFHLAWLFCVIKQNESIMLLSCSCYKGRDVRCCTHKAYGTMSWRRINGIM